MKKNIIPPILAVIIALSLFGCGKKESENPDHTTAVETEAASDAETSEEKKEAQPQTAEETEEPEKTEDTFSFADLAALQFSFSSGAGGWATMLTIKEDGSFSGEYFDGEMGLSSDAYPKGTMYQCEFSGQFTQPEKVNDYTYSMKISELNYEKEAGTEEIIDGVLFCYSDAYGLEGTDNILIYLSGAPLAELPEEFRGWVGYYDLSDTPDTELPFYALNNEAQQLGFSSCNIIESLKEAITYTEDRSASLENSIENDLLTQFEYNEKTKELYDLWDAALNNAWSVLKETKDEETMRSLTLEEREWIAEKEEAVAEAGAEYEGGSMQPMVMNMKATEMTRARVYELMGYLTP